MRKKYICWSKGRLFFIDVCLKISVKYKLKIDGLVVYHFYAQIKT